MIISIIITIPNTFAGGHSHPTESDKTESISKQKKKKHKRNKFKKSRSKKKGFFRTILSVLLLILIIGSGLIMLILPWFFSLSLWFFIGVISVLLLTTILLLALNSTPSGTKWQRAFAEGIAGCLSGIVLIAAIIAIVILTVIAIFGPVGLAYLGAAMGTFTFFVNLSENIAEKKRKKRFEEKQKQKELEKKDTESK